MGHFSFSTEPYHFDDLADVPPEQTVLSLRPTDRNWERIADLPALEELTAVDPSPARLKGLKRLRFDDAKKVDPGLLAGLSALEELAFIWVRGPTDLSALAALSALRALYIENINTMSDFSSLAGCTRLRALGFSGKLGKSQPIDSLDFVASLEQLETFRAAGVIYRSGYPVFAPLRGLKRLTRLGVWSGNLSLDDWEYVRLHFPMAEDADEPLFVVERLMPSGEIPAKRLLDEVRTAGDIAALEEGQYLLLPNIKGFGPTYGDPATILKAARRIEARHAKAVARARSA